ncbi:MAG: copper transporter [Clostridia bacterium]|nr:copper transporter [Clostridia bacterium]MCL6522648.1 copper transporter [Bacillota bacterium]
MIDLRTHVISLVAVFLALGIGLLLGLSLADRQPVTQTQQGLITRLESQYDRLRGENESLAGRVQQLSQSLAQEQQAHGELLDLLVGGRLQGLRVALFDLGSPDEESAVRSLLEQAGAQVTLVATFLGPLEPPRSSDWEAWSAALGLPADDRQGLEQAAVQALVAQLGTPLQAPGPGGGRVDGPLFARLAIEEGLLRASVFQPGPYDAALVLVGLDGFSSRQAADLAGGLLAALRQNGVRAVAAEPSTLQPSVVTPLARTQGVSSVDDIDHVAGQVSAVYLLGGLASGSYGTKPGTQAPYPALVAPPVSPAAPAQGGSGG